MSYCKGLQRLISGLQNFSASLRLLANFIVVVSIALPVPQAMNLASKLPATQRPEAPFNLKLRKRHASEHLHDVFNRDDVATLHIPPEVRETFGLGQPLPALSLSSNSDQPPSSLIQI